VTDIALRISQPSPSIPPVFDVALEGYDLARDQGLRTAVLLSLMLDRRAAADDAVEGDDRGGSWMDQYSDFPLGSRLWLLAREKETDHTAARAQRYAEEALAWLVERRIARSVEVAAEWVRPTVLGITIVITRADGSRWVELFEHSMAA
jgi:phage gp46-like protein